MAEAGSRVLEEMRRFAQALPLDGLDPLVAAVRAAPRVYVHGVGRSGLVMRMFAIRLVHLGIACQVVGEATATAIREGDLLIAASGSGATPGTVAIAARAKALGAQVIALTAHPEAPLGAQAARLIALPGVAKTDAAEPARSLQPPGSIFEQMLLLFLEEVILRLAEVVDPTYAAVASRHANLE